MVLVVAKSSHYVWPHAGCCRAICVLVSVKSTGSRLQAERHASLMFSWNKSQILFSLVESWTAVENREVLVNLQKWPQMLWAAVFVAGDVMRILKEANYIVT